MFRFARSSGHCCHVVIAAALSWLTPTVADAQLVVWQVPCSTLPVPAPGPYFINEYRHTWKFELAFSWGGGTTSGRYNGRPDPAESDYWNDTYLRWTTPGFIADCFRTRLATPGGVIEDVLYFTTALTGYRSRLSHGSDDDDSECDYQIFYDPETCDAGDPDDDSGGPDPGLPGGGSGGWNPCAALLLQPGCYDVYIDGLYDSRICC